MSTIHHLHAGSASAARHAFGATAHGIGEIDMNTLEPHLINENESDIRGIKEGWYAMRRNGTLRLGPFPSRDECLAEIAHSTAEPASPLSFQVH